MMLWICSNIFLIFLSSCYSPTATAQPLQPPSTVNVSTTWNPLNYPSIFVRKTNVTTFECGFHSMQGGYSYGGNYLFSISISPSDESASQVVWSANRDHPVRYGAILNLTIDGELVLKDEDGSIVWTTNTTGKSVVGINLTDIGNLVLFDDQNSIVWQSFEHPTDCLLPGQKLFQGQKLKSSVSSTNSSQGIYFLQVMDDGLYAYVESDPPQAYYGMNFVSNDKGKRYIMFLDGVMFNHSDFGDPPPERQALSAQYVQLMPDGHLQFNEWQSDTKEWTVVDDLIMTSAGDCGYPLFCGKNSICTNKQCSCPSLEYFTSIDDRQLNLGCSEITSLTCNNTKRQHFIALKNVYYFLYFTADMEGVNKEACKQACLNNCSCKAAFFKYDTDASSGHCFLRSELFTIKNYDSDNDVSLPYNDDSPVTSAFIKVQNVTLPPSSTHQVATVASFTIGSFVLLLVVVVGFIMYRARKQKQDDKREEEYLDQVPGMPNIFSYEELNTATENFSEKLGEGGYGSVFKGTLVDGTKIAVKCLEGLAHVKKSFLAEVQSIGSIHHVNLVRLRGFCAWKSRRFLVYDFMSNGSLDRWIYHGNREHILDWECRKKIILDIAKGLAYLHEECRQKVVHLDIKPQNILLDDDFNAKVSDFGLSKLMDRNQTEVMSTIKGTPGYIAPEWRSSIITEKMDVYSFGIVLLEILCGRKIFDRSEPEESWYLLFVFQKCWEQGTLLDMVDIHSEDMQVHKTKVLEMMKVASWCLQTNYKRRPSMSSVVKVLEGGMSVEPNLNYNFTDLSIEEIIVGDEKELTQLSPSHLSGPR